MKNLAERLLSLLNLRTLIIVVAVWVCVALPLPDWFARVRDTFNHAMFRLAMDFSALPSSQTHITVVHVSSVEYDSWLADMPGAERLEGLLAKVEHNPEAPSVVGLVLEQPISLIQSQAEALLSDIQQGRRTKDHLFEEVNTLLGRRERLMARLQSDHVIIGIESPLYAGGEVVSSGNASAWVGGMPQWLQRWLWPDVQHVRVAEMANPVFPYAPVLRGRAIVSPLVAMDEDRIIPGFELQYLQAAQLPVTGQDFASPIIEWQNERGFWVGEKWIEASVFGEVIPLYGSHSHLRSPLRQLSLDAALSQEPLGGWIFVGRDGSPSMDALAQRIAALADGALIIEPLWWSPVKKSGIVLLALLACWMMPRLSRYWKMTSTGLMIMLIALASLLAQSLYRLWLPVAEPIFFLAFSWVVIQLWQRQRQQVDALRGKAQRSLLDLADQLANTGYHEKALNTLNECHANEEVLLRMYQLGETFTEQNDLKGALNAYGAIRSRKRRYKDVPVKLKQIHEQLQTQKMVEHSTAHSAAELDQTQALPGAEKEKVTLGRYEIKRELGRGANGTVFLGFDPNIAREVAIKTLHYQQYEGDDLGVVKERFLKEARAVGRLAHPNIVQVYDMGEQDNLAFMTMDYARGQPLSDYITHDTLLPIVEVYRIVLAVSEALQYAHRENVVHRDVKPSNVIYQASPFQVRVTDFGIARLVDHSQTSTGEIMGSPLYMAPEQLKGEKATPSSDIFSLGVTFYQLLTGRLPFQGENIANLSYAIIHTKHPSVRSIRKELPTSATRITNMALQKKTAHRFASALEFSESIRKALKRDFNVDG